MSPGLPVVTQDLILYILREVRYWEISLVKCHPQVILSCQSCFTCKLGGMQSFVSQSAMSVLFPMSARGGDLIPF